MLRNLMGIICIGTLSCTMTVGAEESKSTGALSAQEVFIRNALVQQGMEKGLHKSPAFRLMMSQYRKNQLAKMTLDRVASENMPDFTQRAEEIYHARLDSDYRLPLRLRVRALEMQIPAGQEAAIRQQLAGIRADVLAGKLDFKQAVMQFSTNAEKTLTQGDTQWFSKGQKPELFYDTAAKLTPANKLSEVIVNQQTAYLLQLIERKEAEVQPFAAVKDQIVADLAKSFREDQTKVLLQALEQRFKQAQAGNPSTAINTAKK